MSIFNIVKNFKDNNSIIYILDTLLQVAIDGEAINKRRHIDMGLYNILNNPKVNQEVIHMGCYPIISANGNASDEFMHFVNNLSSYITYDLKTDTLWAKTADNSAAQKMVYEKIVLAKKEILQYLLEKNLISDEVYASELDYKIKKLAD